MTNVSMLMTILFVLLALPACSFSIGCGSGPRQPSLHLLALKNSPDPVADGVPKTKSSISDDDNNSSNLQALFAKYCDADGLLDRTALESMPPFSEMLADGDLLPKELSDIWDAVPKIENDNIRIDLDSFVQVYKDVDDMFEEDANDDVDEFVVTARDMAIGVEGGKEDDEGGSLDSDLVQIFESISNGDGLLSKDALRAWDEVEKLMNEGLLGEDEFEVLWDSSASAGGEFVNSDGFLAFNVALDDLFDFADEDGSIEDLEDGGREVEMPAARAMVEQGDMPPGVLFANLADDNQLVGMEELGLWVELQEMLEEGDLQMAELRDIYNGQASSTPLDKLGEEAFLQLYAEIDNLFEEEEEDGDDTDSAVFPETKPEQTMKAKEDLLAFLEIIKEGDFEMLPCGLDASETDQKQILNIVKALEMQPSNLVKQKEGNIELMELTGTWELLYSSSSAMKFNNGLSGLGGSFPNGRFAGLKQELTATKVLQDMEYVERIEVNPSSASFDVSVPGSWQLRRSVSLFTGEPSVVLLLEPERVNYGPTSMRADHWKSLGPMNMLDLTYLDEDLRVMRGCTSSDTVFIWKRKL